MDWDEYRARPEINVSTLVRGLKSMLHLKNAIDTESVQTAAMKLGTLIHCLVLEPETFDSRYVLVPDFHLEPDNVSGSGKNQKASTNKNTSYVKSRKSEFAKENAGKTFIEYGELYTARRVAESVLSKPAARMWLEHSAKEVTLLETIEGVEGKGKIDMLHPQTLIDLKTCQSAEERPFWYQFQKLHYGFKLAWYRELVRISTGRKVDVYCIAAETSGDFDCVVYEVPDQLLDNKLRDVKRVLREYRLCKETDSWPGVDGGDDYLPLAVPEYEMSEDSIDWESLESVND